MLQKRKWTALVAGLAALTLLAGCGGGANPTGPSSPPTPGPTAQGPVDGGTLTMGTFADIVNLNPILINDTSSGDLASLLLASLYDVDAQGALVADDWALAAAMPQVSSDGKTYTIKLKETPKWSDGQPVTADDVVYTFKTIANPDVGAPGISSFDKVADSKAIDAHTVQITLKQVYAPFELNALTSPIAPAHVLKDVAPKEMQNNAYGKDQAKTVTDGPFKWAEAHQGQYYVLEKDPSYWGKKSHLDKFVYKVYANQQTAVQGLMNGDVDLIDSVPVNLLEAVKNKEGLKLAEQPSPAYDYLGFNFDGKNFPGGKSPFTGQKTRQAIAYALNRKGMVDSVLKGHGTLLDGPFLSNGWAYTEGAAVHYDYNVEKAKQLLADDGWKAGTDGILEKDGQKFEFKLQYNSGNARREQTCSIIQQNLKDVGIKVNIEPTEWSAFIQNNVNTGKFQAIDLGWQLSIDPDSESIFSAKYFPPAGQNSGWYKNDKLDQLWVDGYSTADKQQRKQVYAQVAKEISTDLPYVFLFQKNDSLAYSQKVHWATEDQPVLTLPYGYIFHLQSWWVAAK